MTQANIRPAAVAGLFYPADADELRTQVHQYLSAAPVSQWQPRAIVTPHAGYPYSGPTAGFAWACAGRRGDGVNRIVLLGPCHRIPITGIATSPASHWRTPLGLISLDQQAAQQLQPLPWVGADSEAHASEHSLEVQVPFIQVLFPKAQLLPLVVGEASPDQVAQILQRYWHDPQTLIAISSDLSHFHDDETARAIDQQTRQAIERCDTHIGPDQACGCRPLCGLLKLAAETQSQVTTMAMCNSGDVTGDKTRVVGYGAYGVH